MSELTKCNHDYCYHEYVGLAGVKCLKCENKQLTARLAAAEARLRRYEPEPDICEHGVTEGDWCEPCNREYKAAAEDEAAKGGRDE